jgi:hypothetical protein
MSDEVNFPRDESIIDRKKYILLLRPNLSNQSHIFSVEIRSDRPGNRPCEEMKIDEDYPS